MLYYSVFRTRWGYFGLAGRDEAVCRTYLPVSRRQSAERELLDALKHTDDDLRTDAAWLGGLQQRIVAYFEGENVDFSTDPALSLDGISPFGRKVLLACRQIGFGRTTTYKALAERIGNPNAARAIGGVMAANPVPLIVPCHRVLRTDGGLGGFSAPGGTATKQNLLRHERLAGRPC